MPYAVDLVRLVTSAILAQSENRLAIDASGAATAVLNGYAEFLEAGGKPFILEESHPHLREMALRAERDRRNRLQQWRFRRPGGESVVTVCLGLGQGTTKGACIFSKTP